MPSRPFYHWYPGDYLADTMGLTEEEDLIYRRMLDAMWISCGLPVDKKQIAKRIRISSRKFCRNFDKTLAKLFIEIDGKLWSPRLYSEYQQALEKSAKARESAAARWHPETMRTHSYPQCERNANHNQSNNITNSSGSQLGNSNHDANNKTSRTQRDRSVTPEDRSQAWGRMEQLLKNHKLFERIISEDPLIRVVIHDLGGWPKIKAMKPAEIGTFRGQFMKRYTEIRQAAA